jgi:hypothetical protein
MAADSPATMGARAFMIAAVILALGFACAVQSERESDPARTPTPSPGAMGTRVTYPACSDEQSPPCVQHDSDGWRLISTGQSDLGPLRTPVTLVERRPVDPAGIEWITVLVPGYACSGDDICRGA